MKAKAFLMTVLVSFTVAVCMTSCSAKKQAIKNLESLSVDIRDNSSRYSVSDWEEAVERFVKVREKISKYELEYTPAEKEKIGALEGRCAAYMAKGLKDGVFDKLEGFKNELRGILRNFLNVIMEDE